jgi:hypothetical protein
MERPFGGVFFVNEFLPAVCMAVTGICITGVTFTLSEGATKLPS